MIIDKVLDFIIKKGLSKSYVEKKAGLSNAYLANIKKSKSEIQPPMVKKLIAAFPELESILQPSNLIKPEARPLVPEIDGDIFTNQFGNVFVPLEDGRYLMGCPIVPHYVKGGPMAGFADYEYFDELPKHYVVVDHIHRGKYLSFDMIGDSMDYDGRDYIASGARLTAREIKKELWIGSKLHLNHYKDFVIEHRDGLCVKRIIAHDTDNYTITCHSLNPDKAEHPDFILNLNDVINLFNVIKVDNPR